MLVSWFNLITLPPKLCSKIIKMNKSIQKNSLSGGLAGKISISRWCTSASLHPNLLEGLIFRFMRSYIHYLHVYIHQYGHDIVKRFIYRYQCRPCFVFLWVSYFSRTCTRIAISRFLFKRFAHFTSRMQVRSGRGIAFGYRSCKHPALDNDAMYREQREYHDASYSLPISVSLKHPFK